MFALGAVSLITDVSAEMVTAILPVYLVVELGMSPAAYGLIDGVYSGATVLLRLVGGYAADRVSRRKAVAGAGYAMSALAKLGLSSIGYGLIYLLLQQREGLFGVPHNGLSFGVFSPIGSGGGRSCSSAFSPFLLCTC